jgi:hypothetical protein
VSLSEGKRVNRAGILKWRRRSSNPDCQFFDRIGFIRGIIDARYKDKQTWLAKKLNSALKRVGEL